MRQRNVKNKKDIINNSSYVILKPNEYKGSWNKVFKNNNPIYLEIGMGKGDFITENAKRYPNINFIGIEKYDSIMALAIKKMPEGLGNLKLIRMDALNINDVFDKEISLIYLNFSDPWPKPRHEKRRLTSSHFLDLFNGIFNNKKEIVMKTDNRGLFEFSLISFVNNGYIIKDISLDLHNDNRENNIETEYERKFLLKNNVIYYVNVEKK